MTKAELLKATGNIWRVDCWHVIETEKHKKFDDIRKCAASAAKTFAERGWRWSGIGVPSEADILETLEELSIDSQRNNNVRIETGRLIVRGNKCWHQI